jgi:uncharacterized protein (DUF433 family)
LLGKARKVIREEGGCLTAGQLIERRNPLIRGWALYHRHAASKRTFTKVDRRIFRWLWQWAYRRHDQKSAAWVKAKYFPRVGGRDWVIMGELSSKEGPRRHFGFSRFNVSPAAAAGELVRSTRRTDAHSSLVDRVASGGYTSRMDYTKFITIEPGKRSGQPCIRGMRITVRDVLEYLAGGMTVPELLADFPELTVDDIRACLAYAASQLPSPAA